MTRRRRAAAAAGPAGGPAAAAAGPTRAREQQLWAAGFARVAGVDEAGRGPLAGPVVAAACVLPKDITLDGLDDSKKLSEEQRDSLYHQITTTPGVTWAASVVERDVIDSINILQARPEGGLGGGATMLSMERAVGGLARPPDYILVDGNRVPKGLQGPAAVPAAAAAGGGGGGGGAAVAGGAPDGSYDEELLAECEREERAAAAAGGGGGIGGAAAGGGAAGAPAEAVVTRDRIMTQLDKEFPAYGFAQHKGYGVPAHLAAIAAHGYSQEHRRSFQPVKGMVTRGIGPALRGGAAGGAGGGVAPPLEGAAGEGGAAGDAAAAAAGRDQRRGGGGEKGSAAARRPVAGPGERAHAARRKGRALA
ncbi:MAG: ribonuclease H-like domain-containing protein [Monoraphidium minutum]|nr:MAG: ribonuclease H-like domain-containing protein [Monoraphidium minutum]